MTPSQLYGRLRYPLVTSLAYFVAFGLLRPKLLFDNAPHSPFAAGAVRLQSGMKSWLSSCHVRLALVTDVVIGFTAVEMPTVWPSTYRPSDPRTAVRPS